MPTLVIKKKIRYNKGITPAEKRTRIKRWGEQKPAGGMQADLCMKSKGIHDWSKGSIDHRYNPP